MATSAENNRDPWGRSLTSTLRRWWWIPVVLAIVGGVVGGLAGAMAPRTAEALVHVQVTGVDTQNSANAIQSALIEASSREVYDAAAQRTGLDIATMRQNTDVAAVTNTTYLSVTATDRDPERAAALANALADSSVEASNRRINDRLSELTRTTSVLIGEQPLADPEAEEQRVIRLGAQLADQQGQMLTQSRRLTLMQGAEAGTATGVSLPLLAAMGVLGGALAGIALALLFGGRRGRMTSITEMRRVYPELEFIPARELPTVVSMEAHDLDRVVLTGVKAPAGAVRGLVEPVAAGFHAAGREVSVTDDVAGFGHSNGSRQQTATLLQSPLNSAIVKRAARDPHAMLLVLVRPHRTRFEWLDEHASHFGDRVCVVVDG